MAELRSIRAFEVRIPFDEEDLGFDVVQAFPIKDHYTSSDGGIDSIRWSVGNPCAGSSLIIYPSEIDYYIELLTAIKNYKEED